MRTFQPVLERSYRLNVLTKIYVQECVSVFKINIVFIVLVFSLASNHFEGKYDPDMCVSLDII